MKKSFSVLFLLLLLSVLSGCSTVGTGSKWYAPNTWSWFSGANEITAAKTAETRVDAAVAEATGQQAVALHFAHVEFRKAQLSLLALSAESPEVQFALRTLGNGLGLLNQFDPLTAADDAATIKLVHDLLSRDAARVAAAESAQQKAEKSADEISRDLAAAQTKIADLEKLSRQANAAEREAHLENLSLANELRAQHMRFWIAASLVVLLAAFAFYARLALGGVGAALHAAGAPAASVQALDTNLSSLGQYLVRTGRQAAAKAEAVLATRLPSAPSSGSTPVTLP